MLARLKARLQAQAVVYVVAGALALCVVGYLSLACYLALAEALDPAAAALVTAAAAAVVIAVLVLLSRGLSGEDPAPAADADVADRIEQVLQDQADPVLRRWVKDNPDRAMVATLALGVAAGYSDAVRRALTDLYEQYAGAEDRRRAGRRS